MPCFLISIKTRWGSQDEISTVVGRCWLACKADHIVCCRAQIVYLLVKLDPVLFSFSRANRVFGTPQAHPDVTSRDVHDGISDLSILLLC